MFIRISSDLLLPVITDISEKIIWFNVLFKERKSRKTLALFRNKHIAVFIVLIVFCVMLSVSNSRFSEI